MAYPRVFGDGDAGNVEVGFYNSDLVGRYLVGVLLHADKTKRISGHKA